MSTTPRDKSSGRPRQRSRKADQRDQKAEQQQNPKVDQRHEDEIGPVVASTDAPTNGAAALPDVPLIGGVAPADAPSIATAAPAANHEISLQTIANAYGDYTRKSFQETRSFVEKLMSARSFDKAIEVQTEFARQAYANFVAESQKICELYSELAKQIFSAARLTQAGR
jgi:DNA-binding transcriptional regulator YhcF (GntR family)